MEDFSPLTNQNVFCQVCDVGASACGRAGLSGSVRGLQPRAPNFYGSPNCRGAPNVANSVYYYYSCY